MSTSTDGQLCFGVLFEEGFEFPWDAFNDVQEWWMNLCGYVNPYESPYDDRGYKPGFDRNDPRISLYHGHRLDWLKQNPVPVHLVNYCHIDHPMYIITIDDERLSAEAYRGYPKSLDLPSMLAAENEGREKLLAFMSEHGIVADSAPAWYLSSYWG